MNAAGTEQRGGGTTAEPSGDGGPATLLRVANVAKAFGATQAVRDASFELRAGEVHALVGENGCGKSTVVKILSGVHTPDAGEIELDGELVPSIRTPREAQSRGIFTVFQEVLVAESCSVLDNVWLGVDDTWRTRVATREKAARAKQMLGELLGREVDLHMAVEELSLSDRQACGIVRALVRDPKILILDEATSALDVATRDRLFAIVGDLSRRGVGVIFITHRMDEIEQIGDRITVMRSGETVAELDRGQLDAPAARAADDRSRGARRAASRTGCTPIAERRGATVLSVRGLQLRPDGRPIDLEVKAGELIGLAGLEGHGGNTFLEALRGGIATEGEVVRHADGRDAVIRSPADAADHDIAYVPRERRLDSVFSWMSIRENFALADARPRHPPRPAATARLAQAPARLRRPPRHRARLARVRDHDAVGRQPAEGDHRPLAGVRPARPAAQRPDPRHRHRGEERPVRAVRRARRARAWRWSCSRPSSTSTSS